MSDTLDQPFMAPKQSIIPTLHIGSRRLVGKLLEIARDFVMIDRKSKCEVVLESRSVSYRRAAVVSPSGDCLPKDIWQHGGDVRDASGERAQTRRGA
jgi:hypothetical protein